jgi:RHS repeat-associated protein
MILIVRHLFLLLFMAFGFLFPEGSGAMTPDGGGTGWAGAAWPAEPGTADTTSWAYDGTSGLVTAKTYPNGKSVAYSYDGFNRLTSRTWARSVNTQALATSYGYDALGNLTSVAYSDDTPGVSYTYGRMGQRASITDAAGTRTFDYNDKFQQTAESIAGLYTKAIGRTYDDFGRVSGTAIAADSYSVGHTYDTCGRLTSLIGNGDSWAFTYLANTNLLSQVAGPHGITVNGTYETQRDLLTRRENKVGDTIVSAFDHANDALGRRTTAGRSGTAFAAAETLSFGYNARSELTSAVSSLVQQNDWSHGFTYDTIGNRLTAVKGQATPLTTSYAANSTNAYTAIQEGNQNAVEPAYDDDGNMLNLPLGATQWVYQWDGENRLVHAEKDDTVIENVYDYMSRRVEKTVTVDDEVTRQIRFVYDGYQLIQELDALNDNALIRSYVWNSEKLASVTDHTGEAPVTYYYIHDTNKNVSELVSSTGTVVAHYEYDPFGALSASTGAYAQANPFRFSNEYSDDDLGLVYYNYRYYSPKLGRWLSRDPIEEQGGLNLYGFCGNDGVNAWDYLGKDGGFSDLMNWLFLPKVSESIDGDGYDIYSLGMYQGKVHDSGEYVQSPHYPDLGDFDPNKAIDNEWKHTIEDVKNPDHLITADESLTTSTFVGFTPAGLMLDARDFGYATSDFSEKPSWGRGTMVGVALISFVPSTDIVTQPIKKYVKKGVSAGTDTTRNINRIAKETDGPINSVCKIAEDIPKNSKGIYNDSTYLKHGDIAKAGPRGEIGRAPKNGQAALDNSVEFSNDGNKIRRIGVDVENKELVILDGQNGKFHGHVPTEALDPKLEAAARKAFPGIIFKGGKAVKFKK